MKKNNAAKKVAPKSKTAKVVKQSKKAPAVKKVEAVALPPRVTRSFSLGNEVREDVLAGKTSVGREDLVARADAKYGKANGKAANSSEAKWSSDQVIGAMRGLRFIEATKETIYYKDILIKAIKGEK